MNERVTLVWGARLEPPAGIGRCRWQGSESDLPVQSSPVIVEEMMKCKREMRINIDERQIKWLYKEADLLDSCS